MAKTDTCRVLLIAGRTGYGRAGDVVEHYPLDEAKEHAARGVLRILKAGEDPHAEPEEAEEAEEAEEKPEKKKPAARRGRRPRPKA